jgi:DNA modification methylase
MINHPLITNVERDPKALKPFPNNPRKHPKKQISQLERNMGRFGPTNPAIIDECDTILAGHARVEVAINLGLTTYPCRRIEGLSAAEKKAILVGDNKSGLNSSWDDDLLIAKIAEILIEEPGLIDLTGFEPVEIEQMEVSLVPEDKDGDPADDILPDDGPGVTAPGDVWICGDHRILCGDSLQQESFERLLKGELAETIFGDPPYNVAINGHVSGLGKVRHKEFAHASGEMDPDTFTNFLATAFGHLVRYSTDGSVHYLCMDWRHIRELQDAADRHYSTLLNLAVWDKGVGAMGSLYRSRHELVFVYKAGNASHLNNVQLGKHGRNRSNVWQYRGLAGFGKGRQEQLAAHPTAKPVQMIADALRDCSRRGSIVLDPFGGFGSTMIAAERTGRKARLIEIDPIYVDRTIRRWQAIAKEYAIHEATGETFAEREKHLTKVTSNNMEGSGDA